MPIYTYECGAGHQREVFCKIADRPDHLYCGECRIADERTHASFVPMRQIITGFNVNPDYQPWVDENLSGQYGEPVVVKSRRHHNQLLKERGLFIKS